ncbi:sigma-70 family RNA polymerase sigma factor [Streptomyces sp. NPDC057798]|uniref:sigma-70 family RNA polymerase sigma factor n=1 Tax=Streptomyces sp. NPDC057798 TaxID=3346252 RepID=UPI0036A12E76
MAARGEHEYAVVEAARRGDLRAQDELVGAYLPLVYNIVGRALNGHADVDDVVQESMLRALRALGSLHHPASFRSWLVAITMNQIRTYHHRQQAAPAGSELEDAYDLADPGADFVDLTILRLGLDGQRREVAQATRWLDGDDRMLLSLWWLEAVGELSRAEVSAALELSQQHTAVRVQRMKAQLETARLVVRALTAAPPCDDLGRLTGNWDGRPSPLWRKRIARHARDCVRCSGHQTELVPAEGLLVGLGLVPVAAALTGLAGLTAVTGTETASAAYGAPGYPDPGHTAAYGGPGDPVPGYGGAYGGPEYSVHGHGGAYGGPEHPGSSNTAAPAEHASAPAHPDPGTEAAGGDPTAVLAPVRTAPSPGRHGHGRRRRIPQRRRITGVAAAVAVLIAGGTVATLSLQPDGEGDKVQSAADTPPAPSSASPTAAESPSPSPSRSPGKSPSPEPSTKSPKPTPTPSRTKPQPETTPPAPRPSATPAAAPADAPAAQVLALVNDERASAGCRPVQLDGRLARAAQLHSEDMSRNQYFDHTSQDGRSFADRAAAQGHPSPGAENIARGQTSPEAVMEAWMNSPGHRENILNCSLTTMGIGLVEDDWTWTQVFGY